MVTLDTEQKPERQHCGRRMCAICRRIKRDKALKVKLMLRRPINQLVAQGIMPLALKTPPAFHEQRKQLERAKTGDLLKAKIQQRPGRDELVRQHILEDVGHVDPSLAERQRMLKKARLADQLNDQLSHRPGPLELIQKNILHTEEPIERAVKEGHIPFKATCEGQVTKPQHPDHYITFEDDSQSSEGAPSPQLESRSSDVLETAAASAGIVTVSLSIPTTGGAVVVSSTSPVFQQTSTESTIQTFAELCNTVVGTQQHQQVQQGQQHTSTQGPPNAQKTPVSSTSGLGGAQPGETSYELLLQQQQLFLQWQLEWQHKYPQIILPAAQKPLSLTSSGASDAGSVSGSSANAASPAPSNSSNNPSEQPPLRPLGKLEEMKVSDLKVELKRRNLPVSGSKPQLIERLKPFTESSSNNTTTNSNGPHVTHMGHILMDTPGPMATDDCSSQVKSPGCIVKDEPNSPRTASPHNSEHDDPSSPPGKTSSRYLLVRLSATLSVRARGNERLSSEVKIEPVQKNHIKSQVVDDVLEILIKNGELPPSAAQDPATPTTPNRQLQQNLVFTAPADSPTQSLIFTAGSPMSPISPIPMEVSQSGCSSPSTPAPPPPPPLPLTAFSIQLPGGIQQLQQQEEITPFSTDLLTSEAELDAAMLLSPQSMQQASPDPQPPQEVTSSDNANLDLKELGLDLETLDPMDFGQLDCDMPMDMDDPDWLDSLMPQSPPPSAILSSPNHHSTTPSINLSSTTDIYDPLLGSSQYSFDLFNMEDTDFKMSSDLSSPMTWDKVDFAT
ncbi:hypothetical protein DBV15_00918 [Temnothorax longispinosus]|uniref:SAP domain-containing protein n=1 Tax=Temnothorax longispinosus TaxID=300112 RepID=A0A4S2JBH0_9HYME|nr:hypothetical protein DBV15_00918 [Temnothorax longispinosus]